MDRNYHDSRRALFNVAMLAPCPFPTRQGTQVFVRHLATSLSNAQHRVHLCTYGTGEYCERLSFPIHRARAIPTGFRSGPHPLKVAADVSLLRTGARVLRDHGCDVIHVHSLEGLVLGCVLAKRTQRPLVYHCHNAMESELPTYYSGATRRAAARAVGRVVDRFLPRCADAVIAFDDDDAVGLVRNGVASERIHVIPAGLLPEEMQSASESEIANARATLGPGPWLVYAGNPDGYQNLPLLWRTMATVRAVRPQAKLLILSHHEPAAFWATLEWAQPADLGVRFVRYSDLTTLRALLAVADVALCPRAISAGTPIKVLNYIAAGVPVVGTRSACGTLLCPASGLAVEPRADAMAAAALRLLDNAPKRETVQATFQRFNASELVTRYEAVYSSVLLGKLASLERHGIFDRSGVPGG